MQFLNKVKGTVQSPISHSALLVWAFVWHCDLDLWPKDLKTDTRVTFWALQITSFFGYELAYLCHSGRRTDTRTDRQGVISNAALEGGPQNIPATRCRKRRQHGRWKCTYIVHKSVKLVATGINGRKLCPLNMRVQLYMHTLYKKAQLTQREARDSLGI